MAICGTIYCCRSMKVHGKYKLLYMHRLHNVVSKLCAQDCQYYSLLDLGSIKHETELTSPFAWFFRWKFPSHSSSRMCIILHKSYTLFSCTL